MRFELYYWPGIPGRGEFVRLALEEGEADYLDVGQSPELGAEEVASRLSDPEVAQPPFAPPYLKADGIVISHVANILQYLGPRLGLAPEDEGQRYWLHGLQLTMTDFVAEIHDVHHPIGVGLYYDDQREEALRRSEQFRQERLPKFLTYFEQVLARNPDGHGWLVGDSLTYADLSLFHILSGLRYAFPQAMQRFEPDFPLLGGLVSRVVERPNIKAYLQSERRQEFNEQGLFRHYPELDG
ncbi:glutathione S-transferase [Litchfieldella xinjiangensis]|uniref:glutathione S-transferase n=1 Tax=Litchfieldella xinjiangensis TaxID=1166948 RepID=UPI0005B7C26A|nr:glutathione S-transferase [Halomonas xinjiangensis]